MVSATDLVTSGDTATFQQCNLSDRKNSCDQCRSASIATGTALHR